ncbi:hypothetical protein [Flavobacterium cellulosilyticum]|uniref:Uncharacterized protein n=1 Tax=Flavobacterium cellulosilyticum TaxID=2541731 RepID=A0A4R5C7V3_9FLAO|nr:hypothetical protein [Flavobacterium cellulosilyticum]TDD94190.1 hypothetical protein E0F76_17255 [Flavobacterium cellulosilyticum]
MKTFKLENETKIETGFKTPENYFDTFSARVMEQLPKEEPKVISIYEKSKIWMYGVAAILIIGLSIPVYTNYFQKSTEIDTVTIENYITYQSSVSGSDIVNLLDEKDIQNMSIDLNIDDAAIENELISNKNLEQYLLN